jgi:phosphopantothenoylcysteine decarboxylase/phosphopantothenate--cysteine ligase
VLVTSGPTHEPIDPVRYIANRSSGAQGTALAAALRDLGARVSFVTGPASVPPPPGVDVIAVETAAEMADAVRAALPADAAVFAAAVADWRVENAAGEKIKKDGTGKLPSLSFAENPDILARVAQMGGGAPGAGGGLRRRDRGRGAARHREAGAQGLRLDRGQRRLARYGDHGRIGERRDADHRRGGREWPRLSKVETARRLAARIAGALA